jgi:ferredoxin--NADP+ reductase
MYVAGALASQKDLPVSVDVFERLPAPFGLLRYGVAPDHLKMKSVSRALQRTLEHEQVRFVGNVNIGTDVSVDELRESYHAVAYTFGAARDRKLAIPGEESIGSHSATDFVMWYSGHPDVSDEQFDLSQVRSAVVIGVGNVAVDVARLLVKSPASLRETDIPESILDRLSASGVRDVHILGRRGPAHAKFTTKELRELGELDGVDVVVDPAQLELSDAEQSEVDASPALARNLEVLRQWSSRQAGSASRRLHLHFWSKPVEVLAVDGHMTAVRIEATRIDDHWGVAAGGTYDLSAQLLLRSVGYRGEGLPGVPFDAETGTVPHRGGRVLRDGALSPGEYVAGWIGRGPVGVLGTNRSDGESMVERMLADVPALLSRTLSESSCLDLLEQRSVAYVDRDGWAAIELGEVDLGQTFNRPRVKLATWETLLAAAAGSPRSPSSPDVAAS